MEAMVMKRPQPQRPVRPEECDSKVLPSLLLHTCENVARRGFQMTLWQTCGLPMVNIWLTYG